MIHLLKNEEQLRSWCGRVLTRYKLTKALTETGCERCRAAFAAYLRSLPDVLPTDKEGA